jgi:urease accessory protein
MLPDWLPWLLQVNDSQFPSGAYAHSLGLEELVQREIVRNPKDLEAFLQRQIVPGLLAFELPYLSGAHAVAAGGNVESLRAMDVELDAWKLAAELRAASRQLGSRRLALVRKLAPAPLLECYAESDAPCHHLIVCALELRDTPVEAAVCAFAYQTLSGYAYASMKLMRLGQERAQSLVRGALGALLSQPGRESLTTDSARIGWFNPLLEIASMRHARAGERLFIS